MIVVAVTPGADAVLAVEVELLPQAADSIAAAAATAATAPVLDLLICGRMHVLLVCVDAEIAGVKVKALRARAAYPDRD